MKVIRIILCLLAFGVASDAAAWHRHRYFHPRVVFFAPVYVPPPYYHYPYYPYYAQPVYYVEQPRPQPAAQPGVAAQLHSGSYWYCQAVGAYYPSVPSCVAGWTKVPAVPPSEQSR